MRIPKRILLLIVSSLAVVSLVGAAVVYRAANTHAATTASTATYTGKLGTLSRVSTSSTMPHGVQPNLDAVACMNMTDLPAPTNCNAGGGDSSAAGTGSGSPQLANGHRPAANSPFNGGANGSANGKGAPNVPDTGRAGAGALLANFNGVNDDNNVPLLGGHLTPPDQGLCVGPASALQGAGLLSGVPGSTSVVVELTNEVWNVYSTSGQVLFGPDTLADLFSDGFASGDPSCNYDPATQTFFFTEIGAVYIGGVPSFFGTGLAVINAQGYAAYGVDTGEGGFCLPDFPHHGFNNDAFYITVREFCGPNEDIFPGAKVFALSKSQLVSLSSSVNLVTFDSAVLDGIPIDGLRPAIGDGTSTEYLLNAFAYDANGNNTNSSMLGFWQVTGDQNITSGSGAVTLSGRTIASEPYAYPVNASSTGDGSCSFYHGKCEITSETYLDPVDSRVLQVQFASVDGATRLYTSLDTALTIGSDPTPVDGAAWFDIDPHTGNINHQGYVGVAGTNLLFPSMVRSSSGTLVMDFSMTSPTLNPSTGYVISKNEGNAFSPVQTTGVGSGPHHSYSPIVFGRHRWGDYSAIALDPSSGNVWMGDEYIPPANQGGSDIADNWGTRVWGLQG